MQKMMEAVLHRHGTAIQVVHGGVSALVKAFFQPGAAKTAQGKATPLGYVAQGQYLYIGPACQEIEADDQVIMDGISFLVIRAECYRDENGIVYRWAVCRRKGGEDAWACQA